ncbi:hypothetical protein AWW67_17585 [Roseivirga seohaensis]|uniref:AbiTii domain-containing protein n=1 Tax=Roseivirga seohaensis TaxID=1914963 RepID=A0A150Y261_9BACT|nr:hypothetical protein [Roseivirga seohaensis]KYG85051.1 hypothetical protein AWW67_17585 [Roseivirga seohaensis]
MKLINDIINELIDTDKSISSPLLKTKVLASRLQNEILLNWVSNELKGYDKSSDLPDYRKYKGNITGTYINGNMQYNDQPVPTIGLKRELEEVIRSMDFNQSIASLEILKAENKSGTLEHKFPAELTGLIQQNWRKMGNPYLQLINCKKSIPVNAVVEILSYVRNNLLDFMLKIDSEFGNITEIEELKTKKEEIATFMSQTIINNSGDGNVVNTGDKAKIIATISINKGNQEELEKHLQNIGLSKIDTAELVEIIDTEEPNLENKTFGQKVNSWTQKMLGKALDGSWNIGIGAAGNLIAEAIKAYYGM